MIYLDTGCLVKLYYPEEDSEVISIKTAGLQIAFTPLHNLELTSAMRLKVFRQEATEDQVLAVLQFVRDDLAAGKLMAIDNVNSATIQVAIGLSNQHSATTGSRSLDTLHCALAQSLQITAFLTTDCPAARFSQVDRAPGSKVVRGVSRHESLILIGFAGISGSGSL